MSITNILSVDVEDYFHSSTFDPIVGRDSWDRLESRVVRDTERLLEIFAKENAKGTFFVLAWVAERHPELVRRIAAQGHEIASHGYGHRLIYEQSPEEFRADAQRAKAILEEITGMPVLGYRAPSFSVVKRSEWALDILLSLGYRYDSSVFPIYHDRYGMPGAPPVIHEIRPGLLELPPSSVQVGGMRLPACGGGYLRLLPLGVSKAAVRHINRTGVPAVIYVHPWEIDTQQPDLGLKGLRKVRHSIGTASVAAKLSGLLNEFPFGTASAALGL